MDQHYHLRRSDKSSPCCSQDTRAVCQCTSLQRLLGSTNLWNGPTCDAVDQITYNGSVDPHRYEGFTPTLTQPSLKLRLVDPHEPVSTFGQISKYCKLHLEGPT